MSELHQHLLQYPVILLTVDTENPDPEADLRNFNWEFKIAGVGSDQFLAKI